MCRPWQVYTLRKEVTLMGYQAISVFTLLAQVIIKLFCSSLCIYNTTSNPICQSSILDVSRLTLSNLHNTTFHVKFPLPNLHTSRACQVYGAANELRCQGAGRK